MLTGARVRRRRRHRDDGRRRERATPTGRAAGRTFQRRSSRSSRDASRRIATRASATSPSRRFLLSDSAVRSASPAADAADGSRAARPFVRMLPCCWEPRAAASRAVGSRRRSSCGTAGLAPADEGPARGQVTSSNVSSRPFGMRSRFRPTAVSPVFSARAAATPSHLYARPLDRRGSDPIPGHGGRQALRSSPPTARRSVLGRQHAQESAIAGGQPRPIADVAEGIRGSATWAEDGTIFVASSAGISRVPRLVERLLP